MCAKRVILILSTLCLLTCSLFAEEAPDAADKETESERQLELLQLSNAIVHSPQYTQRSWSMSDGLPRNAVHSIQQSKDGYLWIGTPGGIARFNGIQFEVFSPETTPEIKSPFIRYLTQSPDGTLWFGGERGGVTSLHKGRFTHHAIPKDTLVRTLYAAGNGALWIGTTNGLACLQDGHFKWLNVEDGLPTNDVMSVYEDIEDTLWIGTGRGLVRYDGKVREYFHGHYYLPIDRVRTLLRDTQGALWIGTTGGGLARKQSGKWTYFKKAQGLSDLFVTSILEDSRGEIWVGTLDGLYRLAGETFHAQRMSDGTSYEGVYAITEDIERNLWIGTKEGLHQLRRQEFTSHTRQNGLTHNNAMAVREDTDGNMWVATWGGGMNRLNGGRVTLHDATNQISDIMLSICQTRDGDLWFGADYDSGLFRFRHGNITRFSTAEGLVNSAVRVIYEDRNGTLWIGTTGALYRFRENKFERFTTEHGLAGNIIRTICEDHEGNLWIGSDHGVSLLEKKKDLNPGSMPSFVSFSSSQGFPAATVVSIFPEDRDTLWIGTEGKGLWKISNFAIHDLLAKTKKRSVNEQKYTTADGLFSDTIYEILQDDNGFLWMTSPTGIFRINKDQVGAFDRGEVRALSCAAFGRSDGMTSVQCNGVSKPAGWKARDGRLWFPTTRGVVVVDPRSIPWESTPPPVMIEEIIVDKKSVLRTVTYSQSTLSPIVVPPGSDELEIRFAALSFKAPEKNRFRYKLEGIDSDWINAESRRSAHYNRLPPGNYNFSVIACNSDGVWSDVGAKIAITFEPHFWQTTWFLALAVIGAVASVGSVGRYAAWSMLQRRLRRLEQQHAIEKERTRIAQDMHDDLGARLSEILLLSKLTQEPDAKPTEVKSRLNRISGAASDLVDNLDAIVWAVNPKNDSFDRFVFYLSEYVPRYLEPTSIRSLFEFPDPLPKTPLNSAARHDLFLVVKEALHNVVKHSGATEVRLSLKIENNSLTMTLADNGKGFETTDRPSQGNGLFSMRERIERLGGTFTLSSTSRVGTTINVTIPILDSFHEHSV